MHPGGKFFSPGAGTRLEKLMQVPHRISSDNTTFSGHCKTLAPEYAKAAKTLATWNPPQYVAKVDATENKEVAARFEVKGFPTLHFFR